MSKKNAAGVHLWEQIFASLASRDDAAIMDPEYDPAADDAKLRRALAEAGWSVAEIEERVKLHKEIERAAPVTSLGVNPAVEAALERLCRDIEAAMARLNMDSHLRIAHGVEPSVGPSAAKINVMMTDESVITVSAFLFRFCGLIARAFARTLRLNPWLWEATNFDAEKAQECILGAPDLLRYWLQIYLSFALSGTHVIVPFRPANRSELLLFEQIARGMEIFAIAHEYGHHDRAHGKELREEATREEYEADQFALRVSYEVERRPLIFPNPYLASGAGGAILLMALKTLRAFEEILRSTRRSDRVLGGPRTGADTHPDALARIEKFDTIALMKPTEFNILKGFRTASCRIMSTVDRTLLAGLRSLSPASPRDLSTTLLNGVGHGSARDVVDS